MSEDQEAPKHYIDTLSEFDRRAYSAIGVFTTWFGLCEDGLTYILAILTEATDWKKFRLVVSGMDARVKCERVRKAIRAYSEMDDNFSERLSFFEQHVIRLRNKISHSGCTPIEGEDRIYFNQFARTHLHEEKADHIDLERLHRMCDWLAWYANDLHACVMHLGETGKVRIIDPQSPPPKAFD